MVPMARPGRIAGNVGVAMCTTERGVASWRPCAPVARRAERSTGTFQDCLRSVGEGSTRERRAPAVRNQTAVPGGTARTAHRNVELTGDPPEARRDNGDPGRLPHFVLLSGPMAPAVALVPGFVMAGGEYGPPGPHVNSFVARPNSAAMCATASRGGRPGTRTLVASGRRDEPLSPDIVVRRRDQGRELHEGRPQDYDERRDLDEQHEQQRDVDDGEQRRQSPGNRDGPEDPLVERQDRGVAAVSILCDVVDDHRTNQERES